MRKSRRSRPARPDRPAPSLVVRAGQGTSRRAATSQRRCPPPARLTLPRPHLLGGPPIVPLRASAVVLPRGRNNGARRGSGRRGFNGSGSCCRGGVASRTMSDDVGRTSEVQLIGNVLKLSIALPRPCAERWQRNQKTSFRRVVPLRKRYEASAILRACSGVHVLSTDN